MAYFASDINALQVKPAALGGVGNIGFSLAGSILTDSSEKSWSNDVYHPVHKGETNQVTIIYPGNLNPRLSPTDIHADTTTLYSMVTPKSIVNSMKVPTVLLSIDHCLNLADLVN